MREIDVQIRRCDETREQLHAEIPPKGVGPRRPVHAHTLERHHRHRNSANVRQSGTQKYAPRQYDVDKPHDQSRHCPDRRESNHHRFIEEQSEREDQVADVAYPQDVSELIDLPVMHYLGEEKYQRQHAEPTVGNPGDQCVHGQEA